MIGLSSHLVIMAKLPIAGLVKRRLAAEIRATEAVRFYRALLSGTLRRLSGDRRWRTWLAVTPDTAAGRFPIRGTTNIPQGRGSLGERMQRLMGRLPPGPVVVIGSDIPGIERADIAAAFRALGAADAVFGPAMDGGYWLVGQRRIPRVFKLFDGVRWSSEHALSDTLKNLGSRKIAFLRELRDLDTGQDYRAWLRYEANRSSPRPE